MAKRRLEKPKTQNVFENVFSSLFLTEFFCIPSAVLGSNKLNVTLLQSKDNANQLHDWKKRVIKWVTCGIIHD